MSDDLKKFKFTEYGYRGAEELKKAQEEIKKLKEKIKKLEEDVKFLKGLRLR